MEVTAFMCLLSLSSGLIATNAESTSDCTHYALIGSHFRLPLPLPLPKNHRLRWKDMDSLVIYDSKYGTSSEKGYSVTQEGALIFPKLDYNNNGTYTAETSNDQGTTVQKSVSLCFLARVLKPKVTFQCDSLLRQVQFNCSGSEVSPVKYAWVESGRLLPNENKPSLVRTSKSDVSNPFSCNVSNRVSSEISDPVQQNCLKSDSTVLSDPANPEDKNKWLGLEFPLMVAILAGGGGLVLVLIVATIICCSLNKRKKKHHIKEEQELRLQWTTDNQQHHYSNERGQAHSQDPAHSSRPLVNQVPGHTGPRVPKSRLNRPRPPDPITGQPLPGPRRQAERGQTSEPTIGNDAESPPPLPKPRKNFSRSQRV